MRTKPFGVCNRNEAAFRRCGVSVVEVIVVIGLFAMMSTLLMPVLQASREAARQTVCEDRLAAIGFDSMMYGEAYKRLPMQLGATGGVSWNSYISSSSDQYYGYQQSTSPLALAASVTTEFDADPLLFEFGSSLAGTGKNGTNQFFWNLDGWLELATEEPDRYLCPALSRVFDSMPTQGTTLALQPIRYDDIENGFLANLYDNDATVPYGTSSYAGCLGASCGGALFEPSLVWQYRGMITSREEVTFDEVAEADGLSNTVMFGENIGTIEIVNRRPTLVFKMNWFSGAVARGRGNTPFLEDGTPSTPLLGHAMNASINGFGSFHPQGVTFVRGDGSVTMVARGIDWETYYALCGAFDTN